MTENDRTLERVIETLKEPVSIDPDFDRRVMAAIEQLPVPDAPSRPRYWRFRISPLSGLAAAAVIAMVMLSVDLFTPEREVAVRGDAGDIESAAAITQFVLVAPDAESVALVGDFNDWSMSATRLARQPGDGVWWVTVSLPPGRYRYAFVVDGANWRRDPNAPAAEDEFGRPNSVVTIGGV